MHACCTPIPDAYLTIGNNVTIGHGAIVHGCTVADEVLIGMGAVILNHAQIGTGCLIAARALVTEGMQVPPNSVVMGIPGRVKPLRDDQTGAHSPQRPELCRAERTLSQGQPRISH